MATKAIISMENKDIVRASIISSRVNNGFASGYLLALGNELRRRMQKEVVEFFFLKKNGQVRHAFGTTMPSLARTHINGCGSSSVTVIPFWDTEKGEWRSAQVQSLIKVL